MSEHHGNSRQDAGYDTPAAWRMGSIGRATHLFLSESEITGIRAYAPQALAGVAHLVIAEDANGAPACQSPYAKNTGRNGLQTKPVFFPRCASRLRLFCRKHNGDIPLSGAQQVFQFAL